MDRKSIVVVGGGVSIQSAAPDSIPGWRGLLESGLTLVQELHPRLPNAWVENVKSDLELGSSGYGSAFGSAAQKIVDELGGVEGSEFRAWMRNAFGEIQVTSPTLIESLANLGVPIATTNFDTLIEKVTGRNSTTWRDPARVQEALQSRSTEVIHLHGVWNQPDSVILSSQSYGTILGNVSAQTLQQAITTLSSLIFVGFGAGLDDPNFGHLIAWLREVFPDSSSIHFRLCLDDEVTALSEKHSGDPIYPIPYGAAHSELPNYLASLVTSRAAGASLELTSEITRASDLGINAICDRVREETVLADHFSDLGNRSIKEMLIPPVILPVTHEQFVMAQDVKEGDRPARSDPLVEASREGWLILAAAEGSGLTSAIEWLLAEAVTVRNSEAVPIVVDFRSLGSGHRPLERAIRKELRATGALPNISGELPRFVLGIDNVSTRPPKIFERMIAELDNDSCSFAVIGCRLGVEGEILRALDAREKIPVVRYLGRLATRDVERMASLVDPARVESLSEMVIQVAQREHLVRTPFTIGLLLSVLIRGESLLGTASETALLDAYVNLLLGRGDPHDDARFSLDSLERSDILSTVAAAFVDQHVGSMSQADALRVLENYFDEVDWEEVPIDVLNNLIRRHVLAVRGDQIRFTQTSFLHLFAAKRMISDDSFREKILQTPLSFSPIVQHYAALTRDDGNALERVHELLDPMLKDLGSRAKIFQSKVFDEAERSQSVEELLERIAISESSSDTDQQLEMDDEEDWTDLSDEEDSLPFPFDDIDAAPVAIQFMVKLSLLSTVLRDSELVRDKRLKQTVLVDALLMWGSLVAILEEDQEFREFSKLTADAFAELLNLNKERRQKFIEEFVDWSPILWSYAGIDASLSSRKLLRTLDTCFESAEFSESAPGSILGAFLAFDIMEPGWTKYLGVVHRYHGRTEAISGAFRRVLENTFYRLSVHGDDFVNLQEFLVNQYADDLGTMSDRERRVAMAKIRQQVKLNRLKAQQIGRSRQSLTRSPSDEEQTNQEN
jgi:hypothetical protein